MTSSSSPMTPVIYPGPFGNNNKSNSSGNLTANPSSPATTTTTATTTAKSTYSDAQLKIFEICAKNLQALPVSKDLPRLAKKFSLFVNNRTVSWMPSSDDTVTADDSSEMEETLSIIVYHLLQHIHQSILLKKFVTTPNFPPYSMFEDEVNMNDHVTLNQFILKNFGEKDAVTQILKACHQTVIIHVLFGARACLMKQAIHFKDVRGAWKILIHFPASQGTNNNQHSRNESIVIDSFSRNDNIEDLRLSVADENVTNTATMTEDNTAAETNDNEDEDEECITVCHKRREQVYMKTTDYWKHVEEYNRTNSPKNANPLPAPDKKQIFIQLFQFEWQIKIVFDAAESSKDGMKVVRVDIELLDILFTNEDGSVNNHPEYSASQITQIKKFFSEVDASVALRAGASFVDPPTQTRASLVKQTSLGSIKQKDSTTAPSLSTATSSTSLTRDSDASFVDEHCSLIGSARHTGSSASSTRSTPRSTDSTSFWSLLFCPWNLR